MQSGPRLYNGLVAQANIVVRQPPSSGYVSTEADRVRHIVRSYYLATSGEDVEASVFGM